MCGIIGYTGTTQNVGDVLLTGLSGLEYRGYDSAGLAVSNGSLSVHKREGDVSGLETALSDRSLSGTLGSDTHAGARMDRRRIRTHIPTRTVMEQSLSFTTVLSRTISRSEPNSRKRVIRSRAKRIRKSFHT